MSQTASGFTELFRGEGSTYVLNVDSKQWEDRGVFGSIILLQNKTQLVVKWTKSQQIQEELWWRLHPGGYNIKRKGERALVLKAYSSSSSLYEHLALRFKDVETRSTFLTSYLVIYPENASDPSSPITSPPSSPIQISDAKSNEFDENAASHKMDLQSRTIAALGAETMKNLSSLTVLIIGLRGVGVETAKNLILTGPKTVTLYDDNTVQIADLGSNFYLTQDDVGNCTRSQAVTKRLSELNPYCEVKSVSGVLSNDFIQSFGAVVITQTLPLHALMRFNELCRTRKNGAAVFILAITHGITAHFFSDFGDEHIVTDGDGENQRLLVIDELSKDGVVSVAAKRHGFDDGDNIMIEDIESGNINDDECDITRLNHLNGIKVKRIYLNEKREKQIFNKFELDLSQTELADKRLSSWKTGGLITQVKPRKEYKFRSFMECLRVPAKEGLNAFFGPLHPDQGAWQNGAGKTIHLLYLAALRFNEENGYFMRLHNEEDSKKFKTIFKEINTQHKESGDDHVCFVEEPFDIRRIHGYSWYFECELSGYCSFLGGVAAQEVVKKFGKYTPIFQWLHSDHLQLIGDEIPSDAIPIGSRYDHQISMFGKGFQHKLGAQNIFLVGTGALGCEYLKGLALMGVCCGPKGKLTCTDMDRIEISNLSRQFLFRAKHVGKPKSITAAAAAKEMNPAFNVEALEMKVWEETEDKFTDEFWEKLDLCWNALDNVNARKYTDSKCLLHGKPLLESGTQGTKCNSEIILPFKTKSYNDGEEQETEGIPMCTLQNFPYLPLHCIEWARSSFSRFETQPKLYNTFMESSDKFLEQMNTASGSERYEIVKIMHKFVNIDMNDLYNECIRFSFDEFVLQYITRIKDLIHLFPQNEKVKDKVTGEVIGDFWSGHKKFPKVAIFDLNDTAVIDYLYSSSQLYAFIFNVKHELIPKNRKEFIQIVNKLDLKLSEWKPPKNIEIKVNDDDEDDDDDDEKGNDEKEEEINELLTKFESLNKENLLQKMNEIEFEKDDDTNFHIDFITAAANARARNYRIKETSRHKCKIIAGKIIAALATTTAMICGLVELEFIKLKLNLNYIHQNAFYNSNINLAVAQFQFFEPDAAIRSKEKTVYDPVMCCEEKHVPYPPSFTSWDSLVVDKGYSLSIGEFVNEFPKLFNEITIEILHKLGKMEKGILLYNEVIHRKKEDVLNTKLIDKYIECYGKLISEERSYVLLTGSFRTKDDDVAILPRIRYYFK